MPASVSVIMPAYNSAATIDLAISSIAAQAEPGVEIIVIDDGSMDDTTQRARAHGSGVRVITQANAGPQAARNAGLKVATGEFIAFLDADDIWLPGKLRAQVQALQANPNAVAAYCQWHNWHAGPDGVHQPPIELMGHQVDERIDKSGSGHLYTRLLLDCVMLTTTVVLRKRVAQKVGLFDPDLRVGEDYDYWLRLAREGEILKLAAVGALYRITDDSASRRPHAINYELVVVRRALSRWGMIGPDGSSADIAAMKRRLSSLRMSHANLHLLRGDPGVALREYLGLIGDSPLRPRLWWNTAKALIKTGVARVPGL